MSNRAPQSRRPSRNRQTDDIEAEADIELRPINITRKNVGTQTPENGPGTFTQAWRIFANFRKPTKIVWALNLVGVIGFITIVILRYSIPATLCKAQFFADWFSGFYTALWSGSCILIISKIITHAFRAWAPFYSIHTFGPRFLIILIGLHFGMLLGALPLAAKIDCRAIKEAVSGSS